MLSLVDP